MVDRACCSFSGEVYEMTSGTLRKAEAGQTCHIEQAITGSAYVERVVDPKSVTSPAAQEH
jgi:hypothetical protein